MTRDEKSKNRAQSSIRTPADDALSLALRTLRLGDAQYCVSRLAAPFSIAFADRAWPIFHVLVEGRCVVKVKGGASLELEAGDVILLPRGRHHGLSDQPGRRERVVDFSPGHTSITTPTYATATLGRCTLVCGQFRVEGPSVLPVLNSLPELAVVRRREAEPWLESTLETLGREAEGGRPGAAAIISCLFQVLFIQVLRHHVAQPGQPVGWIRALSEQGLQRALSLVHAQPGEDLSVPRLAAEAGLSRSAFIARFSREVGEPPGSYVTRFRMQVAASHLQFQPEVALKHLSAEVGYASLAAFKRAFKSTVGVPPGRYRASRAP